VGGPAPAQSIQVYLHDGGTDTLVGSADAALLDPRLSAGDRAAVRNTIDALGSLRSRFRYTGLDDSEHAVKLVLHADKGPAAGSGKIYVPAENPFTPMPEVHPRAGVLFPKDAARHELIHLVQVRIAGHPIGPPPEERGRGADVISPIQAKGVGEGLADAFSLLESRTWLTGARFLRQAPGQPTRVVRDYEDPDSASSVLHVRATYDKHAVSELDVDPHVQGGVVVMFAKDLEQAVGWNLAQDVMWSVLNDPTFARGRQTWSDLADALERQAVAADATSPITAAAIRSALASTKLDDARSSR
jgi:hypothetical protein